MKTILITGATSGIGKATAMRLATHGYNLILCGRRKHKLQELKEMLSAKCNVIILAFDLRDKNEITKNLQTLPSTFERIDILINNAGNAHGLSPMDQADIEDWDAMIDGNVKGLLYISKAIIPQMVKNRQGHIINISSVAGKQTYENGSVYCASKKAVEAISEGMRLDLTKHNIKITNIAPGAVETEFSNVRFKGDTEKAKKVYEGYEPLVAEDVADLISYVLNVPDRVTIADVTIYPKAQSSPSSIIRQSEKKI